MVLTIVFWVCLFLFPESVFMVKLKILLTICSMKSVNEFYVILLHIVEFFFPIIYNTQIVKQDSWFKLMLYGLNSMAYGHPIKLMQ